MMTLMGRCGQAWASAVALAVKAIKADAAKPRRRKLKDENMQNS
jgi:hypothetical protein